jgi:hypothetical protein
MPEHRHGNKNERRGDGGGVSKRLAQNSTWGRRLTEDERERLFEGERRVDTTEARHVHLNNGVSTKRCPTLPQLLDLVYTT